tara:strand:- start:1252 stop:1608 length:357 start_codon:yes stop_codon:yes gene_type:complete
LTQLLDFKQVCEVCQCSHTTLYRRLHSTPGRTHKAAFPAPRRVASPRAVGPRLVNRWAKSEVLEWLHAGNDPRWVSPPKQKPIADREKKPFLTQKLVLQAVLGALLAGLAVNLWHFAG